MKCPKCNCEDVQDISDLTHQLFVCNECDHYWITGIVKYNNKKRGYYIVNNRKK